MNTVITLIGLSKRTSSGLLWTRFWTCWFITFWEFLDYLWTCWFRTKDCFMEVVSSVVGRHGLCVLDRRPTLLLEVPDCPQCLLADFWTLSDQAWDSWLFSVISGRFLNAVWSGLYRLHPQLFYSVLFPTHSHVGRRQFSYQTRVVTTA